MGIRNRHIFRAIAVIVALVCIIPTVSYASSLQEQLDKAQQEREELEGKLDDQQDHLDGLKGEQNTLKGHLGNLNTQLSDVSNNLASLEEKIRLKEQEIEETTAALEEARELEAWQYECMKIRLQMMYENQDYMYLETLFGASSFSEFLNYNDYLDQIAEYDRDRLEEYEANRKFIEEEEARLLMEQEELHDLKVAAEAEKSKVAGLIGQTSNSIADYADQIDDAEAEALRYEQEIRAKEDVIAQIAYEIEMSKAAANAVWRDISGVTFAEGDRYLLANLIYCEAGGEPYEGQLAVGAVVINRVRSAKYPDSVVGVIYQNKQFSPVLSGRLDLALAANKATAACYRAADEAMTGMTNVGNCLYFRTPIEGLTGLSIGGHIFY